MRAIRLLPRLLAGLVLAATVACTDSTGSGEAISGTFTLSTVGGQAVPVVVQQSGTTTLEVTGGSITFNADHTFSTALSTRTTVNGSATTDTSNDTGSYTNNNGRVELTYSDATFDTGILSGNQFTLAVSGLALVFTR